MVYNLSKCDVTLWRWEFTWHIWQWFQGELNTLKIFEPTYLANVSNPMNLQQVDQDKFHNIGTQYTFLLP